MLNLNFSTGRYIQLPPYTAPGYSDDKGIFVDRQNELKYIEGEDGTVLPTIGIIVEF